MRGNGSCDTRGKHIVAGTNAKRRDEHASDLHSTLSPLPVAQKRKKDCSIAAAIKQSRSSHKERINRTAPSVSAASDRDVTVATRARTRGRRSRVTEVDRAIDAVHGNREGPDRSAISTARRCALVAPEDLSQIRGNRGVVVHASTKVERDQVLRLEEDVHTSGDRNATRQCRASARNRSHWTAQLCPRNVAVPRIHAR